MSRSGGWVRRIDERRPHRAPESPRSAHVKYILLIYQNPATLETFSEEERNRVMAEAGEIMEELDAIRGVGRRRGAGRPVEHQDRPRARRRPGDHGRAVRRGEGAAGRLLHRRMRDPRSGRPRSPPAGRMRGTGRWRCGRSWSRAARRCEHGAGRRGPAARAGAAGPRRARPSLRALRRVRGRGTGGAAGRHRPVARPGPAAEPARLADHGRVPPPDRPSCGAIKRGGAARRRRGARAARRRAPATSWRAAATGTTR